MSSGLQRDVVDERAWSPGLTLGHLTLLRCVGVGGMAEVFEARHELLGTRVAVKRLRVDARARPEHGARFLREGRAAASIRHPHVVQVFDVGTHEGVAYPVMELLEGDDLERHLTARGPLPVGEAVDLQLPLLSALKAAHAAGVIHRDLKPANVVLARDHGGRHGDLNAFAVALLPFASERGRALWASLEAKAEPVPSVAAPPTAASEPEAQATPAGVITTVAPAARPRPRRLAAAALGLLASLVVALAAARSPVPREPSPPAATRRPPPRGPRARPVTRTADAGAPRTCIGPNGVNLCL
jgi:serine/threonine protein kinase